MTENYLNIFYYFFYDKCVEIFFLIMQKTICNFGEIQINENVSPLKINILVILY